VTFVPSSGYPQGSWRKRPDFTHLPLVFSANKRRKLLLTPELQQLRQDGILAIHSGLEDSGHLFLARPTFGAVRVG
jgi:hypothetical protein